MYFTTIVGATGVVGELILKLLEERNFPVRRLRCFASPKSAGKSISFREEKIVLETLHPGCFAGTELAFFCAGSAVSKQWIPEARQAECFVVDSSSAFRMNPEVPLVIPEINGEGLSWEKGAAASPNCAATMLLMPLFPLHRKWGAKRIVAATYQAASGGGMALLRRLEEETRASLAGQPIAHPLPYAFNLYPHNSPLLENGYVEEEIKMIEETRKILGAPQLRMSATCVRVPVLRAHSVAANVEFAQPFTLPEIYAELAKMPGLKLFENRKENRFATPFDATDKNEVFCGRMRIDPSQPNTLEFWAVGDQLLKGAALNAVQIAETVIGNRREAAAGRRDPAAG